MLGACSPCCPQEALCGHCCPDKPTQIVFSVTAPETQGDPRQAPDDPAVAEEAVPITCPAIDEEIVVDIEQTVIDRKLDDFVFDGETKNAPLTIDGEPLLGPCDYELWLNGVRLGLFTNIEVGEPTVRTFAAAPEDGAILSGIARGSCGVSLAYGQESSEFIAPGTVSFAALRSTGSEFQGASVLLLGFFSKSCTPGGCLRVRITESWNGSGFRVISPLSEQCTDDEGEDCNAYTRVREYVALAHAREEPTVTASMASIAGTGAKLDVTLTKEEGDECYKEFGALSLETKIFQTYWKASATVKKVDGKTLGGEYYLPTDRVAFETKDIGGPVLSSTNPLPDVNYATNEPEITLLARSGEGATLTPVLKANTFESDTFRIDSIKVEGGGGGYLESDQVFIEHDYRAIVPAPTGFQPRARHPGLRVRLDDLQPPTITIDPLPVAQYPCLDGVEIPYTLREARDIRFGSGPPEVPRVFILEFPQLLESPPPVVATCQGIPAGTRIPLGIRISGGDVISGSQLNVRIQFDENGNGTLRAPTLFTTIAPTIRGAIGDVVNVSLGTTAGGGFYRNLSVASVDGKHGQFYKLGAPASCSGYQSWTLFEKTGGIEVGDNYRTEHVSGADGPIYLPALKRVCPTPTVTLTIQ